MIRVSNVTTTLENCGAASPRAEQMHTRPSCSRRITNRNAHEKARPNTSTPALFLIAVQNRGCPNAPQYWVSSHDGVSTGPRTTNLQLPTHKAVSHTQCKVREADTRVYAYDFSYEQY